MLGRTMHAPRLRIVVVAAVLTLLLCVVAVAAREPLRGGPGQPSQPEPRAPETEVITAAMPLVKGSLPPEVFVVGADEGPAVPEWLWWAIAGVAVAGFLAGGLLHVRDWRPRVGWLRRRRRARATAEPAVVELSTVGPDDDAATARRAVDAALDTLREPADPRAAVIAAYARMEQVLGEQELDRRSSEAPREYLERVLGAERMPEEPLKTLTALFEEARFSMHAIPSSSPRRAQGALESVRLELAAKRESDELLVGHAP